jgi:DNA polymerase
MKKVTYCNKCDICASNKNNPVWGSGFDGADIMFIGEAPGASERRTGLPFVGISGKLLRTILDKYGFNNNNSYFTNIVKCRPPSNRTPELNEIANCLPFLATEIETVKPKIIVLVGSTALRTFYNSFDLSITRNNGRIDVRGNHVIVPVYHPSYLLRSPDKINEFEVAMNTILTLYRVINPMHITKL